MVASGDWFGGSLVSWMEHRGVTTRGSGCCICRLTFAARHADFLARTGGRRRRLRFRPRGWVRGAASVSRLGGVAAAAASVAALAQGAGAVGDAHSDSDGEGSSSEGDVAESELGGSAVADVREWKRVRGRLWELVGREPDPVAGEFPLDWREEKDLGTFWVARGKAATRAPARRWAAADRVTAALLREGLVRLRRRGATNLWTRRLRVLRACCEGGGGSRAACRCVEWACDRWWYLVSVASSTSQAGEAARPRTKASQGGGVSGAKRECVAGSPSGATVAAREAEEVEACRSRARSTRAGG